MNTMHKTLVLLHPPAEVRFGNFDQMWRGANLSATSRSIARLIRSILSCGFVNFTVPV
jgi:hypothetical protein